MPRKATTSGDQKVGVTQGTTVAGRDGQIAAETQMAIAVPDLSSPSASTSLKPRVKLPRAENAGHRSRETQHNVAGNGAVGGQHVGESQYAAAADRAAFIAQIIEASRENAFAIRQRMRTRQATLAHVARAYFGYHTSLPDAERKKIFAAAEALIKKVRKEEIPHPIVVLVHATDLAAEPWEQIEHDTEKRLVKLARQLPAYAWVTGVPGFGALSFARIIGETGDLANYANPGKVWKRLCLAVVDGRAQRRLRDKDEAAKQGYSPRRRAVAYVAFEPVFKAQSPRKSDGHQDDEAQSKHAVGADEAGQDMSEAHERRAGPYRHLYDSKKAEYLARIEAGEEGWTKIHAHKAALRYASKALYRDLWIAWNRDC